MVLISHFYLEDFGFAFFLVMFFYGFGIRGTHHHVAPPFGRIYLELFRSIKQANPRKGLCSNHPFSQVLTLAVSFKGEKKNWIYQDDYILGSVIPTGMSCLNT